MTPATVRRIQVIFTGTVLLIGVVSTLFWSLYGGPWPDYLMVGVLVFGAFVPQVILDAQGAPSFVLVGLFWVMILASVYLVCSLISRASMKRKYAVYTALALGTTALYTFAYWVTVQAIGALLSHGGSAP